MRSASPSVPSRSRAPCRTSCRSRRRCAADPTSECRSPGAVAGRGALGEPPAVLLEVVPVPVGRGPRSSPGASPPGAVAIAACIRVIFSSGLFPSMFPSSVIFLAMALIASGYALSLMADSMIGSSSVMAVLGSPLFTASSTFFQRSARGGCAAVCEVTTRTTPATTHASAAPTVASRCDRFMWEPRWGEGNSQERRDNAFIRIRRVTERGGLGVGRTHPRPPLLRREGE